MNKTEEFIKKAIKIHKNKYDYSKVNYVNTSTKVLIICKEHGEFQQMPQNHLNGSICHKCSGKYKLSTEEWIEKAKECHRDKYNYSKVNYTSIRNKVIIICKIHCEFEQMPQNHLNGSICHKCSGKYKLTTEEWIEKAKEVHGKKYDYSKVNYLNNKKDIIIICKEHGEFEQFPQNHLNGSICHKCSGNYTPTTEEWIEKAKKVHGDKYNYSKVNYINSNTKVIIICKEHGEFKQRPSDHIIKKYNCWSCSGLKMKTTEEFINIAKEIHEGKYDYSKVNYINSKTKVTIICKEHGEFEQIPTLHINKCQCGCVKCWYNEMKLIYSSNTSEFIEKAKTIHGDKYDYSKVNYNNSETKVKIICKEHGEFEQKPNNHINNKCGCPKCNPTGYSKSQIHWLEFMSKYYNLNIQHAENEGEYKIPETNYKADGYCRETNTIFEYDGDFFHGNPEIYNENDYNKLCKKTFGELYLNTLEKELKLISMGYKLKKIWDSEWIKINKSITIFQKKFKKYTK